MKELLEQLIGKSVKVYGIDNAHAIGGHNAVTIKEVRNDAILISTSTGTQVVIPFATVGSVWADS